MRQILIGGSVFRGGVFLQGDLVIENGVVAGFAGKDAADGVPIGCADCFPNQNGNRIDCRGVSILPGFVDVHVSGLIGNTGIQRFPSRSV